MDSTLRQLLQELFNATRELAEARKIIAELEKKLASGGTSSGATP